MGMMGGMGGMPMGAGGGQNQGKEKRRDANLSPDEDLYKEDRPWTEGIIGNRRRKESQEGKESK
ncbi:antigen MTB48 [Mycolicibacterium thermoresistibile ATCC 19527]|uniref:Antigen MTB48 n=2 Tax=Mycolicibacterium thermoresistibile TaxID=1797 RepID=G7CDQ5_MYCT3|nr:antigen MTB48 [Mycolicibacterium thermoresistibile ATCC 19527]